jgi:hypothetical protein
LAKADHGTFKGCFVSASSIELFVAENAKYVPIPSFLKK